MIWVLFPRMGKLGRKTEAKPVIPQGKSGTVAQL